MYRAATSVQMRLREADGWGGGFRDGSQNFEERVEGVGCSVLGVPRGDVGADEASFSPEYPGKEREKLLTFDVVPGH